MKENRALWTLTLGLSLSALLECYILSSHIDFMLSVHGTLDKDIPLQRYFRTEHFFHPETGILSRRKLFLSRLDMQSDSQEGKNTATAKANMMYDDVLRGNEPWVADVCAFAAEVHTRKYAFGSFWTFDRAFNVAKASEYGAVFSIVSSPERIERALGQIPQHVRVKIGAVNYSDNRPENNDIDRMLFSKNSELSWENECRLISLLNPSSNNYGEMISNAPNHLLLDIDLNGLIDCIRVSSKASDDDMALLRNSVESSIRLETVGF